ncbi:PAS domain S-box protein [Nostoc sp. NMS4]|uniref:PAS domain S-box protein n=1 Tax=Nostoc sp. NMS4 TaxID=2815390 RepID=UPI0025CCB930|nr:PAS domain S-box protein [Nostoc sp. NMS4]MBN3927409.1 PAS domain S-box protein [Nostoc sp. NMS4]
MRLYPRLLAYGVAVGSSAIALLLSLWLEPLISRTIGAFFYIAIIISTSYGGFRPGIVTVVLSTLAINYFFIFPPHQFWIEQPQEVLRLAIFLLVALTINLITSNLQHSKQKIKQLNQQLAQENAEQLRMALGAAQMGMWDWNIATGEIKWSPEHEQLFGLTVGSFDGRYETFDAYLHPDDRPSLNQALEKALQTHSIYYHEYRIIWADGSIHWVEGRGQVFYNQAGQPVRMTGTVIAIDERKQAQKKLEQQFEQQRLVMEMTQRIRRSLNLQEILQNTVDEVRQFLGCDRVTIFKFSPSWGGTVAVESVAPEWMAILPLQIYDPCIGEENVEPFKKGLVTAKTDIYTAGISPCHIEFLASLQVRANLVVPVSLGDELWGLLAAHHCAAPREWQSSEIELLRQLGAQVSIAIQQAALFEQVQTELAERKQMEVALSQSERRYRSLVHASSQIVWRTDPKGDRITTPEGWEELTGQSAAECLEWGWFNVVHPEDRDRTFQSWQESYTNRTLYETEYRLLMKDGNYHDFAVRGVPILDAERKINEWIGTCTDITQRKQAEIALQQLNAELEQRVVERTAQQRKTNDRLIETVRKQQQTQLVLLEQAQLLDLAHDTIITRDLNGAISFWNQGAEYMYGWTKAEALGQISYILLKSQFPQPIAEIEAELLEKGYWEGELTHFSRNAQPITVASRWVLQKDNAGTPIKILEINNDITQRKQAEAAMRQYERIVSSTKDGIALLNRNYIYQVVNQAYLDWCNKPDTEVVGKSKRDVLGEKLFDNIIQDRLNRCLAGETIQYEQWFEHPNLVPQFMSVTYTPYRELGETISGAIVSLRDLTQLKQAEQMLELQAVITRNMAEGICLVRADNGVIVYANPKFEQMFGYDSGELNDRHVSIVNYESESVSAEDVTQAIRSAVLQKGESTYEVHNIKKDGTEFWCRATTSVFRHPKYGDVLVAVQQDITEEQAALRERKHIEDALRQSEEKFRQLAENIQAVFWMTDIQSQQVLYVSKAYETIWQRSCDNLYENYSEWLDAIHPEDRPRVELELVEQVKTSQYDKKYRIIRPDGSIRWIRDRAFPIKNEVGEMVRIAGIAEDITEQEKIELMKSEFIGIVSHELRTPLTSIRAAMGLLNTGIYAQKPEKSKRMIEIAAIESDRLVRLVNDILDLERLESGRAVLEKTTCEAADLIEQAVAGLQAIAKQQDITFNIHPTDVQVWAAADAIIQTLTNLLGNALKFSPDNSTITLNVQQQTDRVLFQITDQGRGIPADKLEAIFGRFQQVDASDSRTKGGTGLGLAICRSIIDRHGGQIWVQSTVGIGSTFFFTLPMPGS